MQVHFKTIILNTKSEFPVVELTYNINSKIISNESSELKEELLEFSVSERL